MQVFREIHALCLGKDHERFLSFLAALCVINILPHNIFLLLHLYSFKTLLRLRCFLQTILFSVSEISAVLACLTLLHLGLARRSCFWVDFKYFFIFILFSQGSRVSGLSGPFRSHSAPIPSFRRLRIFRHSSF